MMPAQSAIARFHRDLALGRALNVSMMLAVGISFFFGSIVTGGAGGSVLLMVVLGIWIVLGYHSMRGSRLAASSPSLIAAGELEQAEHHIESALRSFSLFRGAKFMSLHHLAVLRHAQRRWGDAAELCRALLGQRLGNMNALARQSRLILADSLLEVGDVRGAHTALADLYTQRLTLSEAMHLLGVQLDYLWRVEAWEAMFAGAVEKLELANLMNPRNSAYAQAMLALAARKLGRRDWEDYLRRRVELLVDVEELVRERPVLAEVFQSAPADASDGQIATNPTNPPDLTDSTSDAN